MLISIFTIAQTTDICYSAGASFVNVQITSPGSGGTLRAIYLEHFGLGLRVIGCRPTLWEDGMGAALAIRRDLVSADDLRRLARPERNRRTATFFGMPPFLSVPRYYFDVLDSDQVIEDPEGIDFPISRRRSLKRSGVHGTSWRTASCRTRICPGTPS